MFVQVATCFASLNHLAIFNTERMAFASSISSTAFLSPQHCLWKSDPSSFSLTHSRCKISERNGRTRSQSKDVKAVIVRPEIDFTDPIWKQQYREDFDRRFNLPHLKDILDVKPRPTTFSLLNRYLSQGHSELHVFFCICMHQMCASRDVLFLFPFFFLFLVFVLVI